MKLLLSQIVHNLGGAGAFQYGVTIVRLSAKERAMQRSGFSSDSMEKLYALSAFAVAEFA